MILSSAYLKVYDLQVFYQRDQQAAVVQLLGQLGHSLSVGLLVIASIQDLFHGHQTLRHLLRGLQNRKLQVRKDGGKEGII